ncbi:MAG: hypothetical protein PHE25_06535, partial [Candidatus Gracilibacteria bacterium]|nr:hypothetical protein [Candidatus Gracilibacteria bacterium]
NPGYKISIGPNGKKYLILGDNDIFEVKEQRGDVYIAYHPIKQMYIIYKFTGENSGKNTSLLWGLNSIKSTNIDGYYNISSTKIEMWSIAGGKPQAEERKEYNYYYIGKGGDTKYFGDYKHVSDLQQFGNATFFKGSTNSNQVFNELVIHNGEKVKKIPNGDEIKVKSESGKHLLYILYNLADTHIPTTHTLFDLDTMEPIFEKADEFNHKIKFLKDGSRIIGNDAFYTNREKRTGLGKMLGDKKTKIPLKL